MPPHPEHNRNNKQEEVNANGARLPEQFHHLSLSFKLTERYMLKGMTKAPTMRSATARETSKALVGVWRLLVVQTAEL